jgi:hypothetical protein
MTSQKSGGATLLLIAGIGIVAWRAIKGVWPWQSIRLAQSKKKLLAEAHNLTNKPHPALGSVHNLGTTPDGQLRIRLIDV